jgi:hypothetical protein
MTSVRVHERPWESHFSHAGVVFFFLLMISGATYMAVRSEEGANPRRALLASLWPSVSLSAPVSKAIELMGPPDRDQQAFLLVPACDPMPDPCVVSTPCETRFTCTREYTWYSWQDGGSGPAYTVCADDDGIVRKKSEGMAFRLTTW